jgi:hypothetical protein
MGDWGAISLTHSKYRNSEFNRFALGATCYYNLKWSNKYKTRIFCQSLNSSSEYVNDGILNSKYLVKRENKLETLFGQVTTTKAMMVRASPFCGKTSLAQLFVNYFLDKHKDFIIKFESCLDDNPLLGTEHHSRE